MGLKDLYTIGRRTVRRDNLPGYYARMAFIATVLVGAVLGIIYYISVLIDAVNRNSDQAPTNIIEWVYTILLGIIILILGGILGAIQSVIIGVFICCLVYGILYTYVKFDSWKNKKQYEKIRIEEERRRDAERERMEREREQKRMQREREQNEIKTLVDEIESIIQKGRQNAKKEKDQERLNNLMSLLTAVSNTSSKFKSNIISYDSAKSALLDLMDEAKLLSEPTKEGYRREGRKGEEPKREEPKIAYDILGVSPNASPDEIKKARNKKLNEEKGHSDKVKEWADEDKMPPDVKEFVKNKHTKINLAYEVLSDPIKREEYNNDPKKREEYNKHLK